MKNPLKNPLSIPEPPVGIVFQHMISEIHKSVQETQHDHAVDLEVNFQSVTLSKNGIPLFSKRSQKAQMQIRLATQIIPSSD